MFLAYVPLLSAAARGQATTKTMLAQGLKPHALAVLHIGKHAHAGPLASATRNERRRSLDGSRTAGCLRRTHPRRPDRRLG